MPPEVLHELQEVRSDLDSPTCDVRSALSAAVNSVVGPLCRAQCYEATDIFSNGWLTLTKEILHKVSQM
jgi:hypothetical protein